MYWRNMKLKLFFFLIIFGAIAFITVPIIIEYASNDDDEPKYY